MNKARLIALIIKEFKQMFRNKGNFIIGVIMPFALIIIFGYGITLDIKGINIAFSTDIYDDKTDEIYSKLSGSGYFNLYKLPTFTEAEQMLEKGLVDSAVLIREEKSNLNHDILILTNGVDANFARLTQGYITGALSSNNQNIISKQSQDISIRPWFNEALHSSYTLISGLIVLIITLIGALLTSMIVAREWEQSTFEMMFTTPVKIREIIISKLISYFSLGFFGFILCLVSARFLFDIPIRGSLILLIIEGSLYLIVCLWLGLAVSSALKNQFLSSQAVLLASYIPSLTLSGFLFDLTSAPHIIQIISKFVPATWFVEIIQNILFTDGNSYILIRNTIILTIYAGFFYALTHKLTSKHLE